jgi:aminoglycoside phosphotransferase family enzyme
MPSILPDWLEDFRARLGAEVIETHISWLLLTGAFAWKLKKPITLPFLDYGTAARRRHFCHEELRLNRRFAPDLYLGVEAVGDSGECAVKMRRFPESQRLDHVCARGELSPAHLSGLARVVVDFHAQAAVAGQETPFGEPEQVLAAALENFTELFTLLPAATPQLERLERWTRHEFARIRPALAARKAAGRVRECHGDLHLGNLVLLDGHVRPFDCIEFNDDFRWIDVASELAFTYVDLLDHNQPRLAAWLLNAWLTEAGDFEAVPVLRFYAVYKAMVRAKVAGITRQRGRRRGLPAPCRIHRQPAAAAADDHLRPLGLRQDHRERGFFKRRPERHHPAPAFGRGAQAPLRPCPPGPQPVDGGWQHLHPRGHPPHLRPARRGRRPDPGCRLVGDPRRGLSQAQRARRFSGTGRSPGRPLCDSRLHGTGG